MDESNAQDFVVKRTDLSEARWAPATTRADRPLAEGEALLQVDRYSFTRNNITYALAGELGHYWDVFPAEPGWGRIPVWGFADVVASRVSALPEGQRVFGYLPMSPWLKVQPAQITQNAFHDASEHRRHLPALYNAYARMQRDDARDDDSRMCLPAITGWSPAAWLIDNELMGARQVVIASASSKTALCTAFMLGRHAGRAFELIGVTSARNLGFCERTGYYDHVVDYTQIRSLPAQTPTVFVDMSGSAEMRRSVHEHFGPALRYSSAVGLTHGKLSPLVATTGPAPQLFTAWQHITKCQQQYGLAGYEARLREAQSAFNASGLTWLEVVRVRGPAAIEAAYRRVLAGQVEPQQTLILSL